MPRRPTAAAVAARRAALIALAQAYIAGGDPALVDEAARWLRLLGEGGP